MIEIRDCSKRFGKAVRGRNPRIQKSAGMDSSILAVNHVSLDLQEKEVFGLVGSNGAGKSTLLRMMAGIMRPDTGEIQIDGEPVYEQEEKKSKIFYSSDSTYFPGNHTAEDMAFYFQCVYESFSMERFSKLMSQFQLDERRKINTYSKGMKKQLSVILGISAGTKYLFCDETFDGLDPVMRQAVKSMFAAEILNRDFTPVIASHNLRELEDICDHVGLLHRGGILLSRNLEDMKFHIHRIQCVLQEEAQLEELRKELEILQVRRQGSLLMITARGTRIEILQRVQAKNPLFCEIIPLSLEEIFISETEVAGYEIQNLFF